MRPCGQCLLLIVTACGPPDPPRPAARSLSSGMMAQHDARRAGDAALYAAELARVRATAARTPEEESAKRKAGRLAPGL